MATEKRNHMVSRKKIADFLASHDIDPASAAALDAWFRTAGSKSWGSFAKVRETYPSADAVGPLVVFNVGGNKFRVVCEINYGRRQVFLRHVLTHAEYDKGKWKA